ncbi:MAG: diguanylate cyclase [Proteobacteria bacterium]|nr:diguanylate cyclase [Pseudomonadota bacterium]MBU1610435.1 diguanylate cyclase [Pseudomonadota bacterium]
MQDARISECFFPVQQRVFIISGDLELPAMLRELWWPGCMDFTVFVRGKDAIETIFQYPPDMLIVDNRLPDMTGAQMAQMVKGENVYRQLPVVLCVDSEDMVYPWNWNDVEVDDFLVRPYLESEVRDRINLTLLRSMRAMDANPLSKLPGNTSIIQRIQDLIDKHENFGLAYCDLDYFKSYNDKYGFSRGDEVLMMSARLIVNTVKAYQGHCRFRPFVGHVGGDDFVFILPGELVEGACQQVIRAFDAIVPKFYDEVDRKRGSIDSIDRKGEAQSFPIMAVSIAVVFNHGGKLKHYGEVSSIAMELKKKAKENPKSSYVLDQRTD